MKKIIAIALAVSLSGCASLGGTLALSGGIGLAAGGIVGLVAHAEQKKIEEAIKKYEDRHKEEAPPELRTYEQVIIMEGLTADELFIKANAWFVKTFGSAEAVIEFQDKEAGRIMGKYVFTFSDERFTHHVKQTISIEVRDNKVRIVISDPFRKSGGSYRPLKSMVRVQRARKEWISTADSLAAALAAASADW